MRMHHLRKKNFSSSFVRRHLLSRFSQINFCHWCQTNTLTPSFCWTKPAIVKLASNDTASNKLKEARLGEKLRFLFGHRWGGKRESKSKLSDGTNAFTFNGKEQDFCFASSLNDRCRCSSGSSCILLGKMLLGWGKKWLFDSLFSSLLSSLTG